MCRKASFSVDFAALLLLNGKQFYSAHWFDILLSVLKNQAISMCIIMLIAKAAVFMFLLQQVHFLDKLN